MGGFQGEHRAQAHIHAGATTSEATGSTFPHSLRALDVPDKAAVIHTSEAKTHLPSCAARLLRVATVTPWFF